jgi:hypothetical protein
MVQAMNQVSEDEEASTQAIFGLDQQEYSRSAKEYAGGAITLWIVAGLAYNLLHGRLISLQSGLLILPGVFIVSFASIPFFYLSVKKRKVLHAQELNEGAMLMLSGKRSTTLRQMPTLLLFTITTIAEWFFPIVSAVAAMYVLRTL